MKEILWNVYRMPMCIVPFVSVAIAFAFGFFNYLYEKIIKNEKLLLLKKIIIYVFFLLYVIFVLYYTVFSRKTGEFSVYINPLNNFFNSNINKDLIRSMLMNILFFVPLGSFYSVILCSKKNHFLLFCFSIIGFSGFIEIMQYLFHLGVCETNDVLMNFIGGLIGFLSLTVYQSLKNKFGDKNEI